MMSGLALAQAGDKLGVGDAVRVTVFQQPDLTLETRIADNGSISMPLVGPVKVAGLTTAAAAGQIADALKRGKFLNNPQVNVALTTLRSRQVSVLGMVARPGRYPLDESSSQLADVIAAAGGVLPTGAETVSVTREGKEQKVPLIGKGFALQGGETVYVERAPVFYIYGEVTRARRLPRRAEHERHAGHRGRRRHHASRQRPQAQAAPRRGQRQVVRNRRRACRSASGPTTSST